MKAGRSKADKRWRKAEKLWRKAGELAEKAGARSVLAGMMTNKTVSEEGGVVVTPTMALRDQVVRLALHAGYAASCTADSGKWRVVCSNGSQHPSFSSSNLVPYAGRTWCVTVPSGLIVARRSSSDGSVVSQPVIVGNCDDHGNKGAILEYGLGNVMNIKQFSAVEHPYLLPNFGNVIAWSLPFVAEKVADFIAALHKIELAEEEAELEKREEAERARQNLEGLDEIAKRREVIRNKVLAMGKMQMMFATLRKEQENVVRLKGLTGDNKLPKGVLLQGPNAIQASVDFFERSKEKHKEDEMMPIRHYENVLRKSDSESAKKALFHLKKSHEDLAQFLKK